MTVIKGRDEPLSLKGLAVLLKRLPVNHDMYLKIQDRYHSAAAGRGGEDEFDRVLMKHRLGIPNLILHDISINRDFQVDSLIVTSSYVHVFEVKNLGGSLKFLSPPLRVEQEYEDGKQRVYDLSQMDNALFYLASWFKGKGIEIPVYRAFILPYPKKFENKTNLKVLFPNAVPSYIRSIREGNPVLTEEQMVAVGEWLKEEHSGFQPFPMCKRWGINHRVLLTGVECDACGRMEMEKVPWGWRCRICHYYSRNSHVKALQEYCMLVGDTITNKECRWFLGMEDRHAALKLLNKMETEKLGKGKLRSYKLKM